MPFTIRSLDPIQDHATVQAYYTAAPDYWLLADGTLDPAQKATEFFTDCPPGCDPARSHRLGLFIETRLSGVAELSFGFPTETDGYLGLMLLGPWARGRGLGRAFLHHIETLAQTPQLYLAVLDANPRGRAFWHQNGFRDTGLFRVDPDTGHTIRRMVKQT